MTPVLLPSTLISQLLQKLEAFGDLSLQVRSIIHLEKQYPFEQFQAWVDVWPEFTTILLKQKLSEILPCNYYVFTLVMENLKKLLQNTDIVEWENAMFRVFQSDFHQMIEDLANERGFSVMYSETTFKTYKFNASKLKERPVPEGLTVGSLTPDMADLVVKNWSQIYIFEDKILHHMRYLITTYPTVCVCDSKGTPIAYGLVQEYGGLGMLHVEPAYRRRGLGKLVTNLLAQKCLDLGYEPFVGIVPGNEASVKLHVDVGFEETDLFLEWAKIVQK